MIIKRFPCCLHCEDGGEFTLVDAEYLRECSPRGTEEDGVELSVVLKEDPETLRDGKDRMAMGHVLNHFAVDVFCELYRSFGTARRADPSALAGEGNKKRVFASITVYPGSTVSEDSAVEIFVEGLHDLIP
jgi:hypothetical protein